MASKTDVPKFHELLTPTLQALHGLGGSASIEELNDELIGGLRLSTDVVEVPHGRGSQSEVEYRAAWARTYLKNTGLVENSGRGVWALTPKGSDTHQVDPRKLVRAVRREVKSRSNSKAPRKSGAVEEPDVFDEESWREVVIESLLDMSPAAFERLAQRLLRESGFIEVEVTGRSGDGGIDGHGIIRIAGLISFPVLFQCKRYQGSIGPNHVRDFRGAMVGRADKGLLITTGSFTREARKEATRDGAPPIDLIDGELLADKLKELRLGIQARMVEQIEVDRSWFRSL